MKQYIIKIAFRGIDNYFKYWSNAEFEVKKYPTGVYEIPVVTLSKKEAKIYEGTVNVLSDVKRLMQQLNDGFIDFDKLEMILIKDKKEVINDRNNNFIFLVNFISSW